MSLNTSRREFLQHSAAVTAGAALAAALPHGAAALGADERDQFPIVDTHQHLWDLKKFRLPWLKEVPALAHSYVTKDYLEAVKDVPLQQAVYMEVDVEPGQQVEEAEHILGLTKDTATRTVGAVISGRPAAAADFKAYINRYKDSKGIKGVRQVLHVPETKPGFCLQDSFVASVRYLGELGKSYDVCMRPSELGDAVKLAERCPDTLIIIDHCGNADPKVFGRAKEGDPAPAHQPDDWRRNMEALAKRPNTICKISGIVASARKDAWSAADLAPIINHCLDTFGPDRVVFGSDWPVCTLVASLRDWVAALRQIIRDRPLADQQKLWGGNARRLYRLA